jgi:outer membrane murein-binding lipoprotein Lpp
MAQKRLLILVLIPFFVAITSGCVSRNRFDQAITELSTAQGRIRSLEADYGALQSKYAALQKEQAALQDNYDTLNSAHAATQANLEAAMADLDTTRTNLDSTQARLDTAMSDLEKAHKKVTTWEDKVGKTRPRLKLLSRIFLPLLSGEAQKYTRAETVKLFLEWGNLVEEVNDSTLQDKFDIMMSGDANDKNIDDFFIYLVESILKGLE